MPRTTIAAVLAMLLFLAPAASARPADVGYPAYPTPEVPAEPQVMSERITDHPPRRRTRSRTRSRRSGPTPRCRRVRRGSATGAERQPGTTDATARARAGAGYSTYGEPAPLKRAPAPAPVPADDGTPWALIGAGFAGVALLLGSAVLLVARPRRPRVAV